MRTDHEMALTASSGAALVAALVMNVIFNPGCERANLGPSLDLNIQEQHHTVSITGSGLNPQVLQARQACRDPKADCWVFVKFVNDDVVPHDLRSDPHPTHGSCLGIDNYAARIPPGESREIQVSSGCPRPQFGGRYHDETRPDDARFQGRIEQ